MKFNIRVYGILINPKKEVLLSDERFKGQEFTKFPGGGLEFGEGIKDCLIREYKEEVGIDIEVGELIYLTDFYLASAFNTKDQIISVYYSVTTQELEKIKTGTLPMDFKSDESKMEVHRWKSINEITPDDVTFPIDKLVVDLIKKKLLA